MNELAWSYDRSVEYMRGKVAEWKAVTLKKSTLTDEIAAELHEAREALRPNEKGGRPVTSPFGKVNSWNNYLRDIGLAPRTVHRWLDHYDPEEQRLLTDEEYEKRKRQEQAAKVDAERRVEKEAKLAYQTGEKADPWTDEHERLYKMLQDREERMNQKAEEFKKPPEEKKTGAWFDNDELIKGLEDALDKQARTREGLGLTGDDGDAQQAIYDAIEWHVGKADTDSRRIEVLQNIIKYCKRLVNEYQVKVSR